jgi:cholesterol transport system auxiliary component
MMSPIRRHRLTLALLIGLSLTLGGCVSLLPKSKSADLYRFEAQPGEPTSTPARVRTTAVLLSNGAFVAESAGDRLVVIREGRLSYVAGVRWAAPAEVLFKEAVYRAFDGGDGPARLARRGDPAAAQYVLRLDVERFEAQYLDGPNAAPTIVVAFRALLVRTKDQLVLGDRSFEGRVRATDNRMAAFVPAYDQVVSETLRGLTSWVQAGVTSPT